ncbi:MAG: ABC transporter ATP-binding protein [Silvanigrellales bacterium]|nr:ABC transporter ATP-binding protein [Silvanigrellales bacterium]
MLQLEGVGKDFPVPGAAALTILENVSLDVPQSTSLSIVGRSGSGKSTLLSLLAGLERPTRGRILIHGTDITSLSENALSDFRARNVGIVFQNFQLLPHFTALGNVMLAAELAGIDSPREAAAAALSEVGLAARTDHSPVRLSGGEQQRVAIARALVGTPRLLLCDEPTGNLDPDNAEHVFELLMSLRAKRGTGLVLITHDAQLAARCEVRVHVERGRVSHVDDTSPEKRGTPS